MGEAGETISFYVGLGIPHLAVTPEYFEPSIPPNNVITESFVITNEGDDGSTLNYSVTATDPPAFETPSLGPNAGNYFAAYSTDEVSLNYEWVDIDGLGTEAIFEHNDVSTSPILLPFTFPFYDGEYSEIIINPNGWVGFSFLMTRVNKNDEEVLGLVICTSSRRDSFVLGRKQLTLGPAAKNEVTLR